MYYDRYKRYQFEHAQVLPQQLVHDQYDAWSLRCRQTQTVAVIRMGQSSLPDVVTTGMTDVWKCYAKNTSGENTEMYMCTVM